MVIKIRVVKKIKKKSLVWNLWDDRKLCFFISSAPTWTVSEITLHALKCVKKSNGISNKKFNNFFIKKTHHAN
jgi:hypothetical protein